MFDHSNPNYNAGRYGTVGSPTGHDAISQGNDWGAFMAGQTQRLHDQAAADAAAKAKSASGSYSSGSGSSGGGGVIGGVVLFVLAIAGFGALTDGNKGSKSTPGSTSDSSMSAFAQGADMVTSTDLNLRDCAAKSCKLLYVMPAGQHVRVIDSGANGWPHISTIDNNGNTIVGYAGGKELVYSRPTQASASFNPPPSAPSYSSPTRARLNDFFMVRELDGSITNWNKGGLVDVQSCANELCIISSTNQQGRTFRAKIDRRGLNFIP